MKKNKKKVKRDVILLYFRRRRIRAELERRWWALEGKRKELYKLVEYAKIQSRFCVNLDCHRIVGRYLRELEREEIRVTRLQTKSKRTKVYRKGGSNLVGSSRHFHNYVQKASPDSPKAARRGIFIITNKAPASPYNDASPPASYPSPSSGGSACFSHFHPASS